MWRDHIKFFVAYTTATAKKDKAGQAKAVANLKRYTVVFGAFLAERDRPAQAGRTERPARPRARAQGQLDAYAGNGEYAKAASTTSAAYGHMFMTADSSRARSRSRRTSSNALPPRGRTPAAPQRRAAGVLVDSVGEPGVGGGDRRRQRVNRAPGTPRPASPASRHWQ